MRPTRVLSTLSLGLILSALATPALTQEHDTQAWQQVTVTAPIREGVTATMEVQTRITEDASHFGQVILRSSLGFRLDPKTTLSLGYAYVMTDVIDRAITHEHRAWQQLAFPITGAGSTIVVTGRTRLEERSFENRDDLGWRLRQQVKAAVPLRDGLQGVVWTEAFFNFNDTDWGARSGFDRWRNFVGVNILLREGVTLEPGYLNQFVNRVGEDKMDHVANMSLNIKY